MTYDLIELTDAQKAIATARCGESGMDLTRLTQAVFNDTALDGRSTQAKSVKAFLAGISVTVKTTKDPATPFELTDAHKRMIEELAPRVTNVEELSSMVFGRVVKRLSREWRAVHAYAKTVYPEGINVDEEPVEEKRWEPPANIQTLITLVNQHVTTGDSSKRVYNWQALKISDERNLRALMSYLRVPTLRHRASQYERQIDREIFVSQFVRWAHDKPDLTQIEVDQMILAAAWQVNLLGIERDIRRIDKMQEDKIAGTATDDEGKKLKFSMTDVELINAVRTKHEQAHKTLAGLMKELEESRSKRKNERDARGNSVLNMLEAWQNDPAWREAIINLGEREKREDSEEVKRLANMDELIALITGQTLEEGGA